MCSKYVGNNSALTITDSKGEKTGNKELLLAGSGRSTNSYQFAEFCLTTEPCKLHSLQKTDSEILIYHEIGCIVPQSLY